MYNNNMYTNNNNIRYAYSLLLNAVEFILAVLGQYRSVQTNGCSTFSNIVTFYALLLLTKIMFRPTCLIHEQDIHFYLNKKSNPRLIEQKICTSALSDSGKTKLTLGI